MLQRLSALALMAAVAGFAVPAAAQSTWNYASFTQGTTNANTFGNSYSATQGSTQLTVSAWSTGTGSTFAAANIGNFGVGSGFGVRSAAEGIGVASPNHAMDNASGTDMLALRFSNAGSAASVVLTSLTTGWHSGDSDLSLLRWSGAAAPTIGGGSIATLLASGWSLVNNYADMTDDVARATGASTSQGSSWWLISAYNSSWGTGSNTANLSNGNDFVKVLASISTSPTGVNGTVPEPGSLALAASALMLGGIAARRRRVQRQPGRR